jgi:hypothetical protein
VAGERVLCFWTRTGKTDAGHRVELLESHKSADGQWSKPRTIATENLRPETRPSLGITAPRRVAGDCIPIAWGPRSGWIRTLRLKID